MRIARAIGLGALLAFLFRPEVPRYRAERRLGAASAAFEYVIDRPTEVQGAPAILDRITDAALAAASDLPADTRGWALAGSCQLVNGNAARTHSPKSGSPRRHRFSARSGSAPLSCTRCRKSSPEASMRSSAGWRTS